MEVLLPYTFLEEWRKITNNVTVRVTRQDRPTVCMELLCPSQLHVVVSTVAALNHCTELFAAVACQQSVGNAEQTATCCGQC